MSIEQWAPNCRIAFDKFHDMRRANAAADEVQRAKRFHEGGRWRGRVKGTSRLLPTRWASPTRGQRREWNALFAPGRRLSRSCRLKESLNRLWDYRQEGAMLRYLQSWIDQPWWQRLRAFQAGQIEISRRTVHRACPGGEEHRALRNEIFLVGRKSNRARNEAAMFTIFLFLMPRTPGRAG